VTAVDVVCVAAGAAAGAPLRYAAGRVLDGRFHTGTLLANLVGSFVLGLVAAAALDGAGLALVGAGFCGGLTTYSSFAVQTRDLGVARGTAYALVTVLGGLAACALGYVVA
jgi:CrcB protein